MMLSSRSCILVCLLMIAHLATASAQTDLLDLLGEPEKTIQYATASFKTTRVINLHSLENPSAGVFDFKIQHRFGFINDGIGDFFGLDNATVRIGGDLGITDRLMIGVGRSGLQKTYDGFIKWKALRQSTGSQSFPVTLSLFSSIAIRTDPFPDPDRDNLFSSRLYYCFQAIIGRKFSEGFSLQLSPTLVHRNLVSSPELANDVLALGIALRQKLTKRVSMNAEYIYVPSSQLEERYRNNSLSIGFDIETGGHVFQLHFSNSTSMIEKGFIAENTGRWGDMGVHFGFNISRVFNFWRVSP